MGRMTERRSSMCPHSRHSDVLLETLTHRKALGTSELPDVDVWVLRDAEFEARYGEDAQWGLDRIKQRLKARLGFLSEDIGLEVAYVRP